MCNSAHQDVSWRPRMINIHFSFTSWNVSFIPFSRACLSLVLPCVFSLLSLFWEVLSLMTLQVWPTVRKIHQRTKHGLLEGVLLPIVFQFRYLCKQIQFRFFSKPGVWKTTQILYKLEPRTNPLCSYFILSWTKPWVVDTGQGIFSQLHPEEIKLIVRKFCSLHRGQFWENILTSQHVLAHQEMGLLPCTPLELGWKWHWHVLRWWRDLGASVLLTISPRRDSNLRSDHGKEESLWAVQAAGAVCRDCRRRGQWAGIWFAQPMAIQGLIACGTAHRVIGADEIIMISGAWGAALIHHSNRFAAARMKIACARKSTYHCWEYGCRFWGMTMVLQSLIQPN